MGKWCEVKCICSNRRPLPGSDFHNYDNYLKYVRKPRLAKTLEEWEETVKGMYDCGHRNGNLIELWPGDILRFAYALESAFRDEPGQFEIFRKIADFRNYDRDEYLPISPTEAETWRLEIEQLRKFMSGEIFLGWHQKERFNTEFSNEDLLYGTPDSTLMDASRLCGASVTTGNAIEFLW